MTTLETLIAARAAITDPRDWTIGWRHRLIDGRVAHCALGAIESALGVDFYELAGTDLPAIIVLDAAIPVPVMGHIPEARIATYNNTHTHAEVLDWFDRAIERQRQIDGMLDVPSTPAAMPELCEA